MTGKVGLAQIQMHGSAVAWNGRAVLLLGASGSGKSSVALQLMAYGAVLVCDDCADLTAFAKGLLVSAPPAIAGRIEARGVGILQAEAILQARVVLVVDCDQVQTDRFPERRDITILGCRLPLLFRSDSPHFPAAILQCLKTGFADDCV